EKAFQQAFMDFVANIREGGTLIHKYGTAVGSPSQVKNKLTFGAAGADYFIDHSSVNAQGSIDVAVKGKSEKKFTLDMPGLHNQNNALAAYLACEAVGLSAAQIEEGLASFRGVKRR